MIRFVAIAIVLLFAVAACTLLVDNQFKDFGSSCKIPNATANVCGTCVTKNCQTEVDQNCQDTQNSIVSSLASCVEDPSPGSSFGESRCTQFLDDASVLANGQAQSQFQLRTCVASNCQDDCRACIDVDAGTSTCGQCIMAQCGDRLSGVNGCCGNGTVLDWIGQCTDVNLHTCTDIDTIVAEMDGGPAYQDASTSEGCETRNFAMCVYTNCIANRMCQ